MVVNSSCGRAWNLGSFRILAESRNAGGGVGGDFYAFRLREPKRLAVVIGDACGRGSEGAELLPHVLPDLDSLATAVDRPSELLAALNRRLVGRITSDRFVTGAVLELDAARGNVTIANAGHVPAMLRTSAGEVSLIGRASGPPLGIVPDCVYEDESYALSAGDVIVFMTDGVLEAVETDLMCMSKLAAVVAREPGSIRDVHLRLLATLPTYPPERRADDMTLLSLELLATGAAETTVPEPTI